MPQILTVCPLCQRQLVPYLQRIKYSQCVRCQLIVRNPLPWEEELQGLYTQSWQHPLQHTSESGGTDAWLAESYSLQLARSLGLTSFHGLKILDFGAGRGSMLRALRKYGADVCGVEPFGLEFLNAHGFQCYRMLSDLPEGLRVDGIVTIDVVEHLRTPWNTLCQLRKLLKDGGWLFIATPNVKGLSARLSGPRYRELSRPGHLMFFTTQGVERFLARCGFAHARRLKWLVRYDRHPVKRCFHHALQLTGLDGELRYLAWARRSGSSN